MQSIHTCVEFAQQHLDQELWCTGRDELFYYRQASTGVYPVMLVQPQAIFHLQAVCFFYTIFHICS